MRRKKPHITSMPTSVKIFKVVIEAVYIEAVVDIGYRVELQAGRMPRATERMVITDYKHMKCLDGMGLQSFLILFTHATPCTQASTTIKKYLPFLIPNWNHQSSCRSIQHLQRPS